MLKENILWDEDLGLATATIVDTTHGEVFTASAMCSPEDSDMKSKLTGQEIAWRRAYIKYLQYLKNYYGVQYKALNDFQKNIQNCKHYNSDFQIEQLLSKEVKLTYNTYINLREKVKCEKKALNSYISNKAEVYHKYRERRINKGDN